MNTLKSIILLCTIIVLTGCSRSQGEQELPQVPSAQKVEQTQKLQPEFNIGRCLGVDYGDFFPVGWSPDGKFAWEQRLPSLESDFETFEYTIQDMITDKIIWMETFSEDLTLDQGAASATPEKNDVRDRFEAQIRVFGIQRTGLKLLDFPIMGPEGHYSVEMEKTAIDTEMGSAVGKAAVMVKSRSKGVKRVFEGNFNTDYFELKDIALAGFILSPFQERVAIVLARMGFGFEGVCDVKYAVVGAHLSVGFRK